MLELRSLDQEPFCHQGLSCRTTTPPRRHEKPQVTPSIRASRSGSDPDPDVLTPGLNAPAVSVIRRRTGGAETYRDPQGKTTPMRLVVGMLKPTSGTLTIAGHGHGHGHGHGLDRTDWSAARWPTELTCRQNLAL